MCTSHFKALAFLLFVVLTILGEPVWSQNDQCDGGAIKSHEAYLYGRFETRMQSTQGSGIVSSFFLYNWDLNCNWPSQVNEIDIEMTGNLDNSVQFTTHHPNLTSVTQILPTPFNPHTTMVDYAIEWEPTTVRWFINGELSLTFTHEYVVQLVHPMRIFMNLWAVENINWTGVWDPTAMPGTSRYDYVRYYEYTPGSGNAGTANNFTLSWDDPFDTLDATRWDQSEDGQVGPLCTFRAQNVEVVNGELHLNITTYSTDQPTRPVHFGVDTSSLNLTPTDVVYLNGGFNSWCGNCTAMADDDGDGIWTVILDLPLGQHEYQFAVNGWGGLIAQPILGTSCDYNPCDEWTNYGISVDEDLSTVYTPLYCWNSCATCGNLNDGGDCPADLDNDLYVGVNDVLTLLSEFGCTSDCTTDLTGDDIVSIVDVLAVLSAFGHPCP